MRRVYLFYFLKECPGALFWNFAVTALLGEGRSLSQASLALGVMYLAMSAIEVPTGYFADRFGTKRATIIGLLFLIFGFALKAGFRAGPWVNLSFVAAAFGLTLMSGAVDAWLRGYVKASSVSFQDNHYFISLEITGRVATILTSWAAVWVLDRNAELLWVLAAGLSLAALAVGIRIPGGPASGSSPARARLPVRGISRELARPAVYLLVGSAAFFGVESAFRSVVCQPYVVGLGGSLVYLAYFQMAMAGARLAGILVYRHRLIHFGRDFEFVLLALGLFAVAEANAAWAHSFLVFIVPYTLAVFSLGWFFPLRLACINERISDSYRATLLSTDSMALKVTAGLVCLFLSSAPIADHLRLGWSLGAGALAISAVLFFQSGKDADEASFRDPVRSSG